jgi:hypothetical protein
MEGPIALGQLQIVTAHALAAKTRFRLECSVGGTWTLEGKFKAEGYSSNIILALLTNQVRR